MTDLPILQIVGALVLGTLLLGVGTWYGRATAPVPDRRVPPDSDSVATADPDTSGEEATPDVVTIYDTIRVTETRRETLRVPTDFTLAGCFQGEPLRRNRSWLGPDEYTLTYFDPTDRRYKQKTYRPTRPTWALWPAVEIRTTPWGLQASTELGLRWRDWTVTAGHVFARKHRGWTVGLRWRPFEITF
jgi:hypothetical protein